MLWHSSDGLDGTVPGAEKAQKAQIRAAEVSLGVTWGASSGALDMGITSQSHMWDVIPLDIAAGQTPPTSSGEPGSLRGVLDDSGMKPVRGACMSR